MVVRLFVESTADCKGNMISYMCAKHRWEGNKTYNYMITVHQIINSTEEW